MAFEIISETACFGGTIGYYKHQSASTGTEMRFTVFTPAAAKDGPVPVLTWLSGLTCTEDNFTTKAGAYKKAAELGLMIVAPDTSPRGDGVPDDEAYDFGCGAGFYLDATEEPWAEHFKMESYITKDLQEVIFANFAGDRSKQGIFGHSMGGHGALTLGMKNSDIYNSISAFSPIVSPTECPWGQKALSGYLGSDRESWSSYDACKLMQASDGSHGEILIDQGMADPFLEEQLKPQLFEAACGGVGQAVNVRRHDGYDHGYFFISTFVDDHLVHHAKLLG